MFNSFVIVFSLYPYSNHRKFQKASIYGNYSYGVHYRLLHTGLILKLTNFYGLTLNIMCFNINMLTLYY